MMNPAIGISKENLAKISQTLGGFLADEFVLYLSLRNAHWNAEGRSFYTAHKLFEEQYEQLDEMIDDIAERIRTLGHYAPASLGSYLKLTHLTDGAGGKNDSEEFIKTVLDYHERIIILLRKNVNYISADLQDVGTGDFITSLITAHEKMAWQLRAHLNYA